MSHQPRLYLVCYDIRDEKRLRRIYKTMRGYGEHLQYSVFRCLLSAVQLAELRARLGELIHHDEDQILFAPLGAAGAARKMWTLGVGLPELTRDAQIF